MTDPRHAPQLTAAHGLYACAYGNVHRGRDRKADAGPVVAECKCPTTPSQGEGDRAADREATTHGRSQACRPRDGGRRPLTCKTPGRTPPNTTPRGTHPRTTATNLETGGPGACRPKARHSSRQPRPAGTGRGPPKVTPKGPSGVCPRARHVLTPRSLRSLRRGPMWRIELTT